jgi:hypothetical protein
MNRAILQNPRLDALSRAWKVDPALLVSADQLTGTEGAGTTVRTAPSDALLDLKSMLGESSVESALDETPDSGCSRGTSVHSPVASGCGCGGSCSLCSASDADLFSVRTTPIGNLDEEDAEEALGTPVGSPGAHSTNLGPPVASPPDPSQAAGSVVCQGGNMQVWVNPADIGGCNEACIRRHEEKHIADFQADPNYKNICKGVPNGDTFNYRSCEDARRFETAATDVEIACIDAALPGASAGCKATMKNRRDVTLPNYKRQVSNCGC